MASRGLGSLTLDLIAKIGGFTGPLTQAERAANRSMSNIEKRANAFGRTIGSSIRSAAGQFLAFAGVAVTVGSAMNAIKSAIDIADETRDLSIRLGESTETISEFRYAAQQTGTDMDALGKGMKILAKNAADALNPMSSQAKVFDALGIKVKDSEGKLKKLGELVPEIADKFKSLEDGTTKAALAQALFGKSGLDLTEFLNQGADGLQTMADKARELGIVIDQETADAADKFKDDLDDVKGALGGIALQIARELLPIMDELALSFKDTATNGQDVSQIAERIAAGLKLAGYVAGQAGTLFNQVGEFLGAAAAAGEGFYDVLVGLATFDLSRIKAGADLVLQGSHGARDALLNNLPGDTKEVKQVKIKLITADSGSIPDSALRTSAGEAAAKAKADALEKKLAAALAGGGGGGRTKKTGKSDAQKDAEQLLAAYQRMEASYKEQIALVGDVSEVEKLRYELANGEGAKFSEAQKNTLLALAEQKDAQEAENKLTQEAKSLHEQLITPMEQINAERARAKELLDAGKISQEDYNRALDAQHTPAEQMLDDLRFEAELLGKSREQQELLTAARYLGAEAATEQGKAALAALEMEQDFRKSIETQTDIMDGARDSARLFFDDLKEGKGIWDSLIDGAGNFADILYDIAQRKLIEQIFGQMGTTGSGSSGGGWLDAIMSLFGGGGFGGEGSPLASGGWTDPNKFHQVGEHNRPELLMRNGKQYLIPGDRGRVEPMSGGGGGGLTQIINFQSKERPDNRSRKQLAQAAGMSASEAIRSNRG